MGLWMFWFEHDEWKTLFNCSRKTPEQWNAEGEPNMILGILYASIGLVCELVYIPFVIAMLKPEFIQHSCFKFMFLIAIIDMIELPFNSILSGIQCAMGTHFCNNVTLYYTVGCIGIACWYGGCMTCIFLAFNRLFELCFPKFAEKLYGGWRIYIWLVIPVLEVIWCALFEKPALYSIKLHAWFFNPFELVEDIRFPTPLTSHFHIYHNTATMVLMGSCYFGICLFMYIKYRFYKADTVSKLQKLMTIQAVLVCFEMFVAAGICILMQHVKLPAFMAIIAHLGWLMVNGDNPFVYFIVNKSMRKVVIKMMLRWFCRNSGAITPIRDHSYKLNTKQATRDTPFVYLILNESLRKAVFKTVRRMARRNQVSNYYSTNHQLSHGQTLKTSNVALSVSEKF